MLRPFLLLMLVFPANAFASVAGDVNKANAYYNQGKFDDSLDLYQKALSENDKSAVVNYDLGTALYKKGDYAGAMRYLEQAAGNKNVKIKPRAEYNLGNDLYKAGAQKEKTDVNDAIKSMQKALGYYGNSIEEDPNDQEARFNQDFVKKEIERLKKQKQQQQKQDQQNQQNKQNQQDQQNQQNQQEQQNQKNQQSQQSQQNQQNQQQNQQDQQKQQSQQNQPETQKQKEENAKQQAEQSQKELDRKQAEDLLEDYRENEEPKKLLNYMPKKIDDRPVLRDW